jgi:hypothetical protein
LLFYDETQSVVINGTQQDYGLPDCEAALDKLSPDGFSGEESIDLPGAGLRSSAIVLMGSGLKSVRSSALLGAIKSVFEAAIPARLQIATKTIPVSEVEEYWSAPGKPRVVFTLG